MRRSFESFGSPPLQSLGFDLFEGGDFLVQFFTVALQNCPERALDYQLVSKKWRAALRLVPAIKGTNLIENDFPRETTFYHILDEMAMRRRIKKHGYNITPRWLSCFTFLTTLELDFPSTPALTKCDMFAALAVFHHPHSFPTVRYCTLRFHQTYYGSRSYPLSQSQKKDEKEVLDFHTKEFSEVFPCLTHLTIIGPVRVFQLQLTILTHLRLVNVETQLDLFLPRLQSVSFQIHFVDLDFFCTSIPGVELDGEIRENLMAPDSVWKEAIYKKFGAETDYEKFQVEIDRGDKADDIGNLMLS
jgi:hypothetical protein